MVPAASWLWVWCCLQHLPTNTPLLVSRETGAVLPGRWGSVGPTPLTVSLSVCWRNAAVPAASPRLVWLSLTLSPELSPCDGCRVGTA